MKKIFFILIAILLISCSNNRLNLNDGPIKVEIIPGEKWNKHKPVFMDFKIKIAPQFAIWIEDINGNYIKTIAVTKKIAKDKLYRKDGSKKIETLPSWSFAKSSNEIDGITTATPKKSVEYKFLSPQNLNKFIIKMEVNHSRDFNDYFPVDAKKGEENFSWGKSGSGQPALVYMAEINLENNDMWTLELIGHSSPDGTKQGIYKDLTTITTAKNIIKKVTVTK